MLGADDRGSGGPVVHPAKVGVTDRCWKNKCGEDGANGGPPEANTGVLVVDASNAHSHHELAGGTGEQPDGYDAHDHEHHKVRGRRKIAPHEFGVGSMLGRWGDKVKENSGDGHRDKPVKGHSSTSPHD